jgi:hypothetical protein
MEIGEELRDDAERLSGIKENGRFRLSGGDGAFAAGCDVFFGGVFEGADDRGANSEDGTAIAARLRYGCRSAF